MAARIQVEALHKVFRTGLPWRRGHVEAVCGLSFEVGAGEVVALLGPNGAGKSTTIRALLGMVHPDAGVARLVGDGGRVARAAYLPEHVRLPGWLRGRRWLRAHGNIAGCDAGEVEGWLERVGLAQAAGARVATYSKGMRQRLALAQALLGAPEVILLDEPASGLDPVARVELRGWIARAAQRGAAILVCTHDLAEAAQIASRVWVLRAGRVCGTLCAAEHADFASDLERAYLSWMKEPT